MGKYGRLALKKALENIDNRHRIGAVLVKGGKVVAAECNLGIRHAEERAVSKVWDSELVGAIMYVARPVYDKTIKIGIARPCERCEKLLRSLGIKKVIYTVNSGWDWERFN